MPVIDTVIPAEYLRVTERLFPSPGAGSETIPSSDAIEEFARTLGVGSEYGSLQQGLDMDHATRRMLGHFRNNVELLVQKTWVEKADEALKEKVLDRLPYFIEEMEARQFDRALKTFILILQELAYLLFGAQSRKADFIEYVLRIDPIIGLFWWYAINLSSLTGLGDVPVLRSAILLGVCFLASF